MNRAVGRVGEGLLRLTQLPHHKDSESFQDFKGFREESPFSLSSATFSFPSCPSPFPPGRVFLHHSCAYVDALRLTPRSLPFSACVRPVLLTPSAGAHSKCSPFSSLSSRPPGAESLKHRKLPWRSRPAGGRALRLTDD